MDFAKLGLYTLAVLSLAKRTWLDEKTAPNVDVASILSVDDLRAASVDTTKINQPLEFIDRTSHDSLKQEARNFLWQNLAHQKLRSDVFRERLLMLDGTGDFQINIYIHRPGTKLPSNMPLAPTTDPTVDKFITHDDDIASVKRVVAARNEAEKQKKRTRKIHMRIVPDEEYNHAPPIAGGSLNVYVYKTDLSRMGNPSAVYTSSNFHSHYSGFAINEKTTLEDGITSHEFMHPFFSGHPDETVLTQAKQAKAANQYVDMQIKLATLLALYSTNFGASIAGPIGFEVGSLIKVGKHDDPSLNQGGMDFRGLSIRNAKRGPLDQKNYRADKERVMTNKELLAFDEFMVDWTMDMGNEAALLDEYSEKLADVMHDHFHGSVEKDLKAIEDFIQENKLNIETQQLEENVEHVIKTLLSNVGESIVKVLTAKHSATTATLIIEAVLSHSPLANYADANSMYIHETMRRVFLGVLSKSDPLTVKNILFNIAAISAKGVPGAAPAIDFLNKDGIWPFTKELGKASLGIEANFDTFKPVRKGFEQDQFVAATIALGTFLYSVYNSQTRKNTKNGEHPRVEDVTETERDNEEHDRDDHGAAMPTAAEVKHISTLTKQKPEELSSPAILSSPTIEELLSLEHKDQKVALTLLSRDFSKKLKDLTNLLELEPRQRTKIGNQIDQLLNERSQQLVQLRTSMFNAITTDALMVQHYNSLLTANPNSTAAPYYKRQQQLLKDKSGKAISQLRHVDGYIADELVSMHTLASETVKTLMKKQRLISAYNSRSASTLVIQKLQQHQEALNAQQIKLVRQIEGLPNISKAIDGEAELPPPNTPEEHERFKRCEVAQLDQLINRLNVDWDKLNIAIATAVNSLQNPISGWNPLVLGLSNDPFANKLLSDIEIIHSPTTLLKLHKERTTHPLQILGDSAEDTAKLKAIREQVQLDASEHVKEFAELHRAWKKRRLEIANEEKNSNISTNTHSQTTEIKPREAETTVKQRRPFTR